MTVEELIKRLQDILRRRPLCANGAVVYSDGAVIEDVEADSDGDVVLS